MAPNPKAAPAPPPPGKNIQQLLAAARSTPQTIGQMLAATVSPQAESAGSLRPPSGSEEATSYAREASEGVPEPPPPRALADSASASAPPAAA
eukprot:15473296-Alexandrium_andersonii.AAC.2